MIHHIHKHIKHHANTAYIKLRKFRHRKTNINILITTIAVVMIWRGVWGMLDKFLFPSNEMASLITGSLLGIFLLIIDNQKLDELSHH